MAWNTCSKFVRFSARHKGESFALDIMITADVEKVHIQWFIFCLKCALYFILNLKEVAVNVASSILTWLSTSIKM